MATCSNVTEDQRRTRTETASGVNIQDAAVRDTDVTERGDLLLVTCFGYTQTHSVQNKGRHTNKWWLQSENVPIMFNRQRSKGEKKNPTVGFILGPKLFPVVCCGGFKKCKLFVLVVFYST